MANLDDLFSVFDESAGAGAAEATPCEAAIAYELNFCVTNNFTIMVCRSLDSTHTVKRPLEDVDDIPDELKKQKGDPDAPEQDDTKYKHTRKLP